MSQDPPTFFVYHTDKRRRLRGCMPVFVVLGAVALVGLLAMVPIRLKPAAPQARNGRIYFRNDPLLHFNMRLQSPRPFELPRFVDPVTNNFGRVDVPVIPQSRMLRVEPPSPFAADSDSFVLEGVDLLELPPEDAHPGTEPAAESAPPASLKGEAEPEPAEVAAPPREEGASAPGAEPVSSSPDGKDASDASGSGEDVPGGAAVPLLPELPGGEEVAA